MASCYYRVGVSAGCLCGHGRPGSTALNRGRGGQSWGISIAFTALEYALVPCPSPDGAQINLTLFNWPNDVGPVATYLVSLNLQ